MARIGRCALVFAVLLAVTLTVTRSPVRAASGPEWDKGAPLTKANVIDILGHAPKKLIRSLALSKPQRVKVAPEFGAVTLRYKVTDALSETDTLSIGSQTAYGAHRAMFLNPNVQVSRVEVVADWTDQYGKTRTEPTLVSVLTRPTVDSHIGWDGLVGGVYADNKLLYCISDERYVDPEIYYRLREPGCLSPLDTVSAGA